MKCKKCGSDNIQVINEVKLKKKRGCLWWCFIGWWLFLFLGIFTFLFRRGQKAVNKTKFVCLNCGNKWG